MILDPARLAVNTNYFREVELETRAWKFWKIKGQKESRVSQLVPFDKGT